MWVHGGRIPKVTLSMLTDSDNDGKTVEACLESDVPFGSFDVPVVVTERQERSRHWSILMTVLANSAWNRQGVSIELDKDKHMVLYKRTVREVSLLPNFPARSSAQIPGLSISRFGHVESPS